MLRYRFKWNRHYGFDLFYGNEGSFIIQLWSYEYHPYLDFKWVKTNVKREISRRFMRFDYGGAPNIYFDWIIGDMIREYEQHTERDE